MLRAIRTWWHLRKVPAHLRPKVREMRAKDKVVELIMEFPALMHLGDEMANFLAKHQAPNYVECEAWSRKGGFLILSVQRKHGIPPGQMAARYRAGVERALATVRASIKIAEDWKWVQVADAEPEPPSCSCGPDDPCPWCRCQEFIASAVETEAKLAELLSAPIIPARTSPEEADSE